MFMIITEMAHQVKEKRRPEPWTSGVSWPFLAAADASEAPLTITETGGGTDGPGPADHYDRPTRTPPHPGRNPARPGLRTHATHPRASVRPHARADAVTTA